MRARWHIMGITPGSFAGLDSPSALRRPKRFEFGRPRLELWSLVVEDDRHSPYSPIASSGRQHPIVGTGNRSSGLLASLGAGLAGSADELCSRALRKMARNGWSRDASSYFSSHLGSRP